MESLGKPQQYRVMGTWHGMVMTMSQGGKLPSLLASLGDGVLFSWPGSVLTSRVERWDSDFEGKHFLFVGLGAWMRF